MAARRFPLTHVPTVFLGAILLLLTTSATAIDIGSLSLKSRAGEDYRAELDITFQPDESASQLVVDKAPPELYQARGHDYAPFLDNLAVEQESLAGQKLRVTLKGGALTGPPVLLILVAEWPRGRQEQQFLLEQPVLTAIQVGADQTLDTIAKRLSKGTKVSYLEMMYALYLKNPNAFYRNNMNNLKAGATLLAPEPVELEGLDRATVYKAIRDQYEAWKTHHSGKATTEAGELLSVISDDELSKPLNLDADPDALQKRLRALAQHNSGLEKNNQQMWNRMDDLEAQVAEMTRRLLPQQPGAAESISSPEEPQSVIRDEMKAEAAAVKAEPVEPIAGNRPLGQTLALSSDGLIAAMLLGLAAMGFIWFGNPVERRT